MNRLDELVRSTLEDRAARAPSPVRVVDRVLTKRPRRRGWLVVGTAAAATIAIVAVGVGVARDPGGGPAPVAVDSADDRAAAIYATALERYLHESFRREGGVPPAVQVLIRPLEDAGWSVGRPEAGDPIPREVRDAIAAELTDLTEISWVEKPDIDPGDTPDNSDPVIRLDLLPDGDEVSVSVAAYHGFDNGWVDTYVLEPNDEGQWVVTGTDTPVGLT